MEGLKPPVEIESSVARFRNDHPDASEAAFIMMNFCFTETRAVLVAAIKRVLWDAGIAGLLASDKTYHDDLLFNVLTYIYGCGIGVAVFERTDAVQFNPNVSFEVGYMMGHGKPVCFLKDDALKTLPTDLLGRLYIGYSAETRFPDITILRPFKRWLDDKGLSKSTLHPNPRLGKRPSIHR